MNDLKKSEIRFLKKNNARISKIDPQSYFEGGDGAESSLYTTV